MSGSHYEAMLLEGQVTSSVQTFGAPLSSAASVRFERLRDRINLYALSEIQECLDEKESLVFLVFGPILSSRTLLLGSINVGTLRTSIL